MGGDCRLLQTDCCLSAAFYLKLRQFMGGNTKILIVAAAVIGGAIGVYYRPSPSLITAPLFWASYFVGVRGRRLTRATTDDNGDIVESPAELAAQASQVVGRDVNVNAYALARNIHSEEASSDSPTQAAIAYVAVNVSHGDIVGLLTRDKNPSGVGKFGHQSGRWASTAADPYESDLQIAETVLSGNVPDPTNGAVHYFRPTLQDILFNEGKVRKTSDQIEADWGGQGYTVPGVDSGLMFFGPA